MEAPAQLQWTSGCCCWPQPVPLACLWQPAVAARGRGCWSSTTPDSSRAMPLPPLAALTDPAPQSACKKLGQRRAARRRAAAWSVSSWAPGQGWERHKCDGDRAASAAAAENHHQCQSTEEGAHREGGELLSGRRQTIRPLEALQVGLEGLDGLEQVLQLCALGNQACRQQTQLSLSRKQTPGLSAQHRSPLQPVAKGRACREKDRDSGNLQEQLTLAPGLAGLLDGFGSEGRRGLGDGRDGLHLVAHGRHLLQVGVAAGLRVQVLLHQPVLLQRHVRQQAVHAQAGHPLLLGHVPCSAIA